MEQTRREKEIQELKELIIAQSWLIIKNEGWQALSIRKIADAIAYSSPTIYKYFENKEAILAHFSKKGYILLGHAIQESLNKAQKGEAQIRAIAKAYWQFAANHIHHYRIMFGLGIPACETINSSYEMKITSGHILQAITNTLSIASNSIANEHQKLKTFWSMLHGFIAIELLSNNEISNQIPETVEDAVEGFIFTLKYNK